MTGNKAHRGVLLEQQAEWGGQLLHDEETEAYLHPGGRTDSVPNVLPYGAAVPLHLACNTLAAPDGPRDWAALRARNIREGEPAHRGSPASLARDLFLLVVLEELVPVMPLGVLGVRQHHLLGIAGVPGVLGLLDLLTTAGAPRPPGSRSSVGTTAHRDVRAVAALTTAAALSA